jgi:hypothetical protein
MKVRNGNDLIELKLKSKDSLLAQVRHSYRAYPLKSCMLGAGYL